MIPVERLIEILMVEDNPADVDLTRHAMESVKIRNKIHVVEDGVEAMRFLRKQGPYGDRPTPDLILLDLNLPRKDGREVLAEVKQDPDLRRIPVIVLTSSQAEEDVAKAYDDHANSYLTKPVTLDGLVAIASAIEGFWLSVVTLPPQER